MANLSVLFKGLAPDVAAELAQQINAVHDELATERAVREADAAELKSWRDLLTAVVTCGMERVGLVYPRLWPNPDWPQDVALVAFALHTGRERAKSAEAQAARLVEENRAMRHQLNREATCRHMFGADGEGSSCYLCGTPHPNSGVSE